MNYFFNKSKTNSIKKGNAKKAISKVCVLSFTGLSGKNKFKIKPRINKNGANKIAPTTFINKFLLFKNKIDKIKSIIEAVKNPKLPTKNIFIPFYLIISKTRRYG